MNIKEYQKNRDLMCRLCGGGLEYKFQLQILNNYMVSYYRCSTCFSLQTEEPYWLDEAYLGVNKRNNDTGAVQRNINNFVAAYCVSKIFKLKDIVDIGGGDGLLCRLLRDAELNCYVDDKYVQATYADGYTVPNFLNAELVLSFEVIEHFPSPSLNLSQLFSLAPQVVMLSTLVYEDQDSGWWYLAPDGGQHIFFYSKKSFTLISKKYGYNFFCAGHYIFLTKSKSVLKKWIIMTLLNRVGLQLIKPLVFCIPHLGARKDFVAK